MIKKELNVNGRSWRLLVDGLAKIDSPRARHPNRDRAFFEKTIKRQNDANARAARAVRGEVDTGKPAQMVSAGIKIVNATQMGGIRGLISPICREAEIKMMLLQLSVPTRNKTLFWRQKR
ncbi:MAG TPA: hypothetical protein GXZ24_05015 [Firmicutes bacterium]|nr:hypothetical protein [Bacillota bacterium]